MHPRRADAGERQPPVGRPFEVAFAPGLAAAAVRLREPTAVPGALRELGLTGPRPTLVLIGGADGLGDAGLAGLRPLFRETLAPLVAALAVAVVDGGTDAGVMRLMGQARAETGATFPLIGVSARGTVALPTADGRDRPAPGPVPLEPHHTHFVLVPGAEWGDESPWLARVAGALAGGAPVVTVLVNGGAIAWEDVAQSVAAGRPVLVIAGSGGTADTLAAALSGATPCSVLGPRSSVLSARARELIASGLLRAVPALTHPNALADAIEQRLSTKE